MMKMMMRAMVITLILTATSMATTDVAQADGGDGVNVVDVYYRAGREAMENGYLNVAESRFLASARYALSELSHANYQAGDLNRSLKALGELYALQGKNEAAMMANTMSLSSQ